MTGKGEGFLDWSARMGFIRGVMFFTLLEDSNASPFFQNYSALLPITASLRKQAQIIFAESQNRRVAFSKNKSKRRRIRSVKVASSDSLMFQEYLGGIFYKLYYLYNVLNTLKLPFHKLLIAINSRPLAFLAVTPYVPSTSISAHFVSWSSPDSSFTE